MKSIAAVPRTKTPSKRPRPTDVEAQIQGKSHHDRRLFILLAETFQALGDTSRVQIVWALSKAELSVGRIAELLGMSQPAVSHHLRTLRNLHLVRVRRQGRESLYALDDEHIESILSEGIDHVEDLLQ